MDNNPFNPTAQPEQGNTDAPATQDFDNTNFSEAPTPSEPILDAEPAAEPTAIDEPSTNPFALTDATPADTAPTDTTFADAAPTDAATFDTTPTDTPAFGANPTDTPAFTTTPTDATPATGLATPPKKKSKIGLIVAICALAVLLIGGSVAGFLFLNWRNSDEVVLLESITDLLDTRAAIVTGDMNIDIKDADSPIRSIQLASHANTALVPSSTTSTLTIVTSDDTEIELTVATAILSDGSLYLKIGGIVGILNSIDLPEEYTDAIDQFEDIISQIDDEWIKISLQDILDSELGASFGDAIDTEAYDCTISAIKNLNTDASRSDLIALYKTHPFLEVDKRKDGKNGRYTDFEISGVRTELISFLNAAQDKPLFGEFTKCSEDITKHTFTNEDFETDDDTAIEGAITFGIDTAAREIGYISINGGSDEISISGRISIVDRLDSLNIDAPTDATSILDIIEDIIGSLIEVEVEAEHDEGATVTDGAESI